MRVLLVNQHFPPQYIGGAERATQSLARELAALGDEVSIVARCPGNTPRVPITIRERLPDDSRLYRLRGGQFDDEKFLEHHDALEREFTALLIERNPEVVHFHHLRNLSPRLVEIAAGFGAGIVVTLHDFYFACPRAHLQKPDGSSCAGPDGGRECAAVCFASEDNALARWSARHDYYRLALSLAHRVVCCSSYVSSYFEAYGVPRSRLRIVPLGVSPAGAPLASQEKSSGDNGLSLAFCGSVIRHKGPDVILQALKLAGIGRVKLTMFGQTPDAEYVEEMKQLASGIPDLTLNFHGPYNWSDLNTLLAGVDCVISPSQVAETFGLVPREALIRGIPVLVSRLGALPEAIREGENGFAFDPGDPSELAGLLTRLSAEPELPARLRLGARATRIQTPAGHAASMRSVYEESLDPFASRGLNHEATFAELQQKYRDLTKLAFA